MIAIDLSFADLAAALAGVVSAVAAAMTAAASARLRRTRLPPTTWDPRSERLHAHLERSIGDVATADYVAHPKTRDEVDLVLQETRRKLEALPPAE